MEILGVKVDPITYQEALEKTKELLESGGKHHIVTPNPEIIVVAQKDSEFKYILNRADLSLADGAGLVKLANLTGKNLPERITGVDFTIGLAGLAEEFGYSMFLLGGSEGIAEKAAKELKREFPKLKIVGTFSGNPNNDEEILNQLKGKETDILLVAFGAPKQEKWIARNIEKADFKLAIGVGGALDYISGEKKRAPKFMQNLGLEWLHRLVREPSRIKRQMALPQFVFLSLKNLFNK